MDMLKYKQIGEDMTKIISKTAKCSHCGTMQNYKIFNFDDIVNLENYNIFKNCILNVCSKCGYLNFDLAESSRQPVIVEQSDGKLSYAKALLGTDISSQQKLQLYALIFDNQKMELSKKIADYYEDPSPDGQQRLKSLKIDFKSFCEKLLKFLQKNDVADNNKNIFAKLLEVEVLAAIGNEHRAKDILSNMELEKKLNDFLQEVILIGDITCCNL